MRSGFEKRGLLLAFFLAMLTLPLFASGPYGADDGEVVSTTGTPLVTKADMQAMAAAGTGWIRVEMRSIPGHTTWDSTALGYYDTIVNNARNAGLQVLMLVDGTSWAGGQAAWEENNAEVAGGNGRNDYVVSFAQQALSPIMEHFSDRVRYFEIWNEPNSWTTSYGVGGTFMYPSNFAWLLAECWKVAHVDQRADVVIVSGGVLGLATNGDFSYDNAGAQYIDDTYQAGIQYGPFREMRRRYGTYPVDGVAQHIYIDQGDVMPSSDFRLYEDYVREAYTKYEGLDTRKKTYITEVGWHQTAATQELEDENLVTTFQTIDSTPYIHMAIWFQWQDHPAAGLYYGVVESNGSPKLALPDYENYETVQGRFVDRSVFQPIADFAASAGPVALGNPEDLGHGAFVYDVPHGEAQDYAGGSLGILTVYSGPQGTFDVSNEYAIRCLYEARGGPDRLGLPVDEEAEIADKFYRQDFERGSVSVPVQAAAALQNACELHPWDAKDGFSHGGIFQRQPQP